MRTIRKPVIWVLASLLYFIGSPGQCQTAESSPAKTPTVARTTVRLATDKGDVVAYLDDKPVASLARLKKEKETITAGGVEFRLADDAKSIRVEGHGREVIVEADKFAGWAAKVPDQHQLALLMNEASGEMELQAGSGNTSPVTMRFSDGGAAELKPGSIGHLDVFLDKTYYFSGYGKVNVNSADGDGFGLSNLRPPLMGGPLGQKADAKGGNRFKRLTPLIEVRFGSVMEKEVRIDVGTHNEGSQLIKLVRGEKRKVAFPNGSKIEFSLNSESHMVEWRIEKGLFRFSIEGFECWHALGLSHQDAGQQWDGGNQAVDLTNYTTNGVPLPNHNLYATFSRSVSAAVAPSAMLQYSPINPCTTYNVSAVGGSVILSDSDTGQQLALSDRNQLIKPGMTLTGPGGIVAADRIVNLSWDAGSTLDMSGVLGQTTVERDTARTINQPGGNGGSLDVVYTRTGEITITAKTGDFLLQPKPLDNWSIELHEGDTLTLNLDTRKGIFTLRTGEENPSNVKISTADGFQPLMHPDTVLTFIIGRPGSLIAGRTGDLVFFEAGGTGIGQTTDLSTAPPFGPRNTLTDVSQLPRIDQPPASVVTPGP